MHIQENVSLAPYTTLRIGGPARYFARAEKYQEVLIALKAAHQRGIPVFLLGGGSNLVVADAGFPGLALNISNATTDHVFPLLASQEPASVLRSVTAGVDWDAYVRQTCEDGFSGVECLAGIPGTVGASPVQNIGAYGQEVANVVHSVLAIDLQTHRAIVLSKEDCRFAYRSSIFNSTHRGRYLIWGVNFRLDRNARPNLTYPDLKRYFEGKPDPSPLEVYDAVREIRARKGMLIDPANPTPDSTSAGSFFKNPVVLLSALDRIASTLGMQKGEIQHWPFTARPEAADPGGTVPGSANGQTKLPAAWLIERAGFPKGYTLGPVGISTRHTLALTNRTGTATCADLFRLRDQIVAGVHSAFGITLEQEPVYLS